MYNMLKSNKRHRPADCSKSIWDWTTFCKYNVKLSGSIYIFPWNFGKIINVIIWKEISSTANLILFNFLENCLNSVFFVGKFSVLHESDNKGLGAWPKVRTAPTLHFKFQKECSCSVIRNSALLLLWLYFWESRAKPSAVLSLWENQFSLLCG